MAHFGDFMLTWGFLTVIAAFFHFGATEPLFVLGLGVFSAMLTAVFSMLDDAGGCDEWMDEDE